MKRFTIFNRKSYFVGACLNKKDGRDRFPAVILTSGRKVIGIQTTCLGCQNYYEECNGICYSHPSIRKTETIVPDLDSFI